MRFTSILPSALLAATAIAAPSSSTLEARQRFAPLHLAAFAEPGCRGESSFFPIMPPNIPVPQPFTIQSVSLSRPLAPSERIEYRRGLCEGLISALGGTSSAGCFPVNHAQCLTYTIS